MKLRIQQKKLMQYCFWGIVIILFCCFMPVDVFEKSIEKGLYGGLATCIIVLLYWLFVILPISAKNKIKNSAKQAKQAVKHLLQHKNIWI